MPDRTEGSLKIACLAEGSQAYKGCQIDNSQASATAVIIWPIPRQRPASQVESKMDIFQISPAHTFLMREGCATVFVP